MVGDIGQMSRGDIATVSVAATTPTTAAHSAAQQDVEATDDAGEEGGTVAMDVTETLDLSAERTANSPAAAASVVADGSGNSVEELNVGSSGIGNPGSPQHSQVAHHDPKSHPK